MPQKRLELSNIMNSYIFKKEDEEVLECIAQAANSYLLLVVKYITTTRHRFKPNVTRAASDLYYAIEDRENSCDIWKKYSELLKVAKQEGVNLWEMPLKMFGMPIY